MKRAKAVRGAVGIVEDAKESIIEATEELMEELMSRNRLQEEELVSVQFTVTADLRSANPATAFRKLGYPNTPLFCSLEPSFDGAMERLVRVLVTAVVEEERDLEPVYKRGAEKLRPDLQGR